jgi:Amt family ammonium transporter
MTTHSTLSACTASAEFCGAIMTGVFASKAVNPAGNDGLLYGNPSLLVTQLIASRRRLRLLLVGSAVILLAMKAVVGLRVNEDEERQGLDLSQHSESAYVLVSDYEEMSIPKSGHVPAAAKAHSQA